MALFNNCGCRTDCLGISVLASVVVGVIAAFLRITGAITVTPAFLWVALGIAVVYLAVLLVSTALSRKNICCAPLSAALLGALGTILFGVILLGITFAATSVTGAVITGLLIAFSALTFTATACLIRCIAECGTHS